MASTFELTTLAQVTIFSGGTTASLANNATVLSSAFNNAQSNSALLGYRRGRFVFSGTFGGAPAASTGLQLYFIRSQDGGSTYETSSVLPPNLPGATIPLDATNTTQQRESAEVDLPAGSFKVLLVNAGTGQQISSGWAILLLPITEQITP